jgi:O-antigen ligase
MQDDIAKQVARWVALGALFLIPLAPLIVANTYFFLIELAVVAWAVLALLDKEYRPRYSWISTVVVAFVAWMFIADSFASNAAKSFWSNFERMEGWILLIHLLGFFFASSAVLRVEKKWRAWFLMSLGVSAIVSGYALLQLGGSLAIHQGSTRIDATLGNSAYLAVYLLFNVFIALWLALTEKYSWLKWSLIALAALEAVLLFYTETRGTIIGLVLGLTLAAFLTALTANKRARRAAAGAFVFIFILVGGFYLARNSDLVQNNHVLQRIASISLNDGATRFTIWHMALQGVRERPIVGWGQEGFNYIFNKYYDPSLYKQEPWFDRAHNAFIDWLTAGGVPAFLLYLSLFGSALVLLWRSSELSRPERIALTAALVGYAVHNLFVFDNLYSYIYFFALLALIDSQVSRPIARLERASVLSAADGTMYALPVAAVSAFALVWLVNVPGMQVASKLITALSPSSKGIGGNIALFQDLAKHPSFAGQEVREQLVSFAASVAQNAQATSAEKQQALTLAVSEMQKQVAAYPLDAREHLQLSYVYRIGGDGASALKEVAAATELSPKKEAMWIERGSLAWDMGDVKAAQEYFNTAYALGVQFTELAVYAAAGNIATGDTAAADKVLIDAYGTTKVDSDILVAAYYRTKNWPRLIELLQARVAAPTADANALFSLASAYYVSGDIANAIKAINTAVAKYPDTAAAGAAAIKQIQGGK